jgi:hypothetical protein
MFVEKPNNKLLLMIHRIMDLDMKNGTRKIRDPIISRIMVCFWRQFEGNTNYRGQLNCLIWCFGLGHGILRKIGFDFNDFSRNVLIKQHLFKKHYRKKTKQKKSKKISHSFPFNPNLQIIFLTSFEWNFQEFSIHTIVLFA